MHQRITEEIALPKLKEERETVDRFAFFFLTAVLIIVTAFLLFEAEIFQLFFLRSA